MLTMRVFTGGLQADLSRTADKDLAKYKCYAIICYPIRVCTVGKVVS